MINTLTRVIYRQQGKEKDMNILGENYDEYFGFDFDQPDEPEPIEEQ